MEEGRGRPRKYPEGRWISVSRIPLFLSVPGAQGYFAQWVGQFGQLAIRNTPETAGFTGPRGCSMRRRTPASGSGSLSSTTPFRIPVARRLETLATSEHFSGSSTSSSLSRTAACGSNEKGCQFGG